MHLSSARMLAIILEGSAMTTPHPKETLRKENHAFSVLIRLDRRFARRLITHASFSGSATAVDAFVTATTGQPYGVATIEIPVEVPVVGKILPPVQVTDPAGRILYPISDDVRVTIAAASERPVPQPGRGRLLNRVGSLIRELTNSEQNLEQTVSRRVSFLFLGSEPLRVRLGDARGEIGSYDIIPHERSRHARRASASMVEQLYRCGQTPDRCGGLSGLGRDLLGRDVVRSRWIAAAGLVHSNPDKATTNCSAR